MYRWVVCFLYEFLGKGNLNIQRVTLMRKRQTMHTYATTQKHEKILLSVTVQHIKLLQRGDFFMTQEERFNNEQLRRLRMQGYEGD